LVAVLKKVGRVAPQDKVGRVAPRPPKRATWSDPVGRRPLLKSWVATWPSLEGQWLINDSASPPCLPKT